MFCKVAKSVYICISKQGKVTFSPRQDVGQTEIITELSCNSRQVEADKEFFSKIFA